MAAAAGRSHTDRVSTSRREFVAGDASRLPGGIALTGYAAAGLEPGVHLGMPSASLTVIFSLDGPVVAADTATALTAGRAARLDVLVAGLQPRTSHVEQPAHQCGVQLAIDPSASRALFGVPAAQVSGLMATPFDPDRHTRALWQRVGEIPTWEGRFDAIAQEFARRAARGEVGPRRELVGAWRLLTARRGTIAIDEVTRHVGLSGRQLREQFRREFGIGPKEAARLMRFEHAQTRLSAQVRAGVGTIADVAAACGYADQAHLSREFRGYTGMSPSAWVVAERRNIQAGGHTARTDWTA